MTSCTDSSTAPQHWIYLDNPRRYLKREGRLTAEVTWRDGIGWAWRILDPEGYVVGFRFKSYRSPGDAKRAASRMLARLPQSAAPSPMMRAMTDRVRQMIGHAR